MQNHLTKKKCTKSVIICTNYRANPQQASCVARGSLAVLAALQQTFLEQELNCHLETFQCLGHCEQGPTLRLMPSGQFFHHVTVTDIPKIITEMQKD